MAGPWQVIEELEVADPTVGFAKAALIDLDATFFVQFAFFLLLYLVLSRAFFRPYVEFLRRRDEATEGMRRRASAILEEARALEAAIEERLSKARSEAMQIRRSLAEEGNRLRTEIASRERMRMQEELERHLKALEAEKARILAEAERLASDLASLIAEKAKVS